MIRNKEDYRQEDQRTDFIIGMTVAILLTLTIVFVVAVKFKSEEILIINQEESL